jgi:hypothetical protein
VEIADGTLWLGTPRGGLHRGGIRLGSGEISQWGGLGPRDTPWHLIDPDTVTVMVGAPQAGRSPRAARAARTVMNLATVGWGVAPEEFRELNGGVRLDWRTTDGQARWATGSVNWGSPLSPLELHAALVVPPALCRSEHLRQIVKTLDDLTALLQEIAAAANSDQVDAILGRRA